MGKIGASTATLTPGFTKKLDELIAALRNSSGQVDAEQQRALLALDVSILVLIKDFHPSEEKFKTKADELHNSRQIGRLNRLLQGQEGIQVEIEFAPDKLGALVG